MEMEWWQWAVAGIVLVLAELAVPAFVLIWFGLGALVSGSDRGYSAAVWYYRSIVSVAGGVDLAGRALVQDLQAEYP